MAFWHLSRCYLWLLVMLPRVVVVVGPAKHDCGCAIFAFKAMALPARLFCNNKLLLHALVRAVSLGANAPDRDTTIEYQLRASSNIAKQIKFTKSGFKFKIRWRLS